MIVFDDHSVVFPKNERDLGKWFFPDYHTVWLSQGRATFHQFRNQSVHLSNNGVFASGYPREVRHQAQNAINDVFLRRELGVNNPIQKFLENRVEDLDGGRDGDDVWRSVPAA